MFVYVRGCYLQPFAGQKTLHLQLKLFSALSHNFAKGFNSCVYFFADSKCIVCQENVGQAHRCINCHKYVYLITCGYPVEGTEEGYGQSVTCKKCRKGQVIYSANLCYLPNLKAELN